MTQQKLLLDPFKNLHEFNHQNDLKFNPHNLPFMSSVWPTIIMSLAYLIGLRITERIMKNRKPFQLKQFLAIYNAFQVSMCIYFVYNVFRTGFSIDYLWNCYKPGYENLDHVKLLYLTYFIKGFEFIETFCFMLRRNFRQVSFLHVYHHVTTFVFAYLGVAYVGNGMAMTIYTLNMLVHAVMYSYYFTSLFISDNKLIFIKKSITIMQMTQFCLVLFNVYRSWHTNCGVAAEFYYMFVANILFIFYHFYEFYKKAYDKKNLDKKIKLQKRRG